MARNAVKKQTQMEEYTDALHDVFTAVRVMVRRVVKEQTQMDERVEYENRFAEIFIRLKAVDECGKLLEKEMEVLLSKFPSLNRNFYKSMPGLKHFLKQVNWTAWKYEPEQED